MQLRDAHFYAKPLLVNMGWGGLAIATPVLADRFGASAPFIGFMAAAGALTYTAGAAASGGLSDRLGCKRVSVAGTFLMAAFLGIMGLARTKWELFACNATACFFCGFFWPPFAHWIGSRNDSRPLHKRLQVFCVSLALGRFAGPMLGGMLFVRIGPHAPFFVASLFGFLVFLSLLAEPPPLGAEDARAPVFDEHIPRERKNAFLYSAWLGVMFGMFCAVSFNALFPKLGEGTLGMSPETIGRVMTAGLAAMPIGFFWLGRHNNWHYRAGFLSLCHVSAALGLLLTLAARGPWAVFFSLALINAGFAGFYFSSIYYSLARGEGQGKASGLHEALIGSGAFLGPLLGGLAAGHYGLRAPYAVCLIAQSAVFGAHLFLRRRLRRGEAGRLK